jgi:hypothetical protein
MTRSADPFEMLRASAGACAALALRDERESRGTEPSISTLRLRKGSRGPDRIPSECSFRVKGGVSAARPSLPLRTKSSIGGAR